MSKARLIIGITGASGVILGVKALQLAASVGVETHLVMSKPAEMTLGYETNCHPRDVAAMADVVYQPGDVGAAIASGSFRAMGMLIAPCSINTLSEIAYGLANNLLTRAADVQLKERRRVVLMVRETPLHTGHLRAMTQASEIGAVIMPPAPAWYAEPKTLGEVEDQLAAKALDLFGIEVPAMKRWGEDLTKGRRGGRD
ncbi:MAG: UbiX family flavin prenyltransferase [Rhodobacteraceae bacterium]|nr:UbiX family flavin prenyltransferase [Paracoccaceae bacterium]